MQVPIPYSGNEKYIFISYSHRDTYQAFEIITRLKQNGYRVWFDGGIDPGTEWDENIALHINECGYFIALMSNNYLNSNNCKDELNYARDLEKERLIVYLEDVTLPAGMAMRINRLQSIFKFTYGNEDDFYKKLFTAKNIEVCQEKQVESQPQTPPVQQQARPAQPQTPPVQQARPVQPQTSPVQQQTRTVQPQPSPVQQARLVQQQTRPVQPQPSPVQQARPVQPQTPPVQQQARPVQPQTPPVQQQARPVQPQTPPVQQQARPVQPQTPPVQQQARPVQPQTPPVQQQTRTVQPQPSRIPMQNKKQAQKLDAARIAGIASLVFLLLAFNETGFATVVPLLLLSIGGAIYSIYAENNRVVRILCSVIYFFDALALSGFVAGELDGEGAHLGVIVLTLIGVSVALYVKILNIRKKKTH